MDPLSITTAVLAVGTRAYSVAEVLYRFIDSVRHLEQNVSSLAAELESFSTACKEVDLGLRRVIPEYDSADTSLSRLWVASSLRVKQCEATILQLENAIEKIKQKRSKLSVRAWGAAQFNMTKPEIDTFRARIASHSTALQVHLLVINISVSHLAPQLAGQGLSEKLDQLQNSVNKLKRHREENERLAGAKVEDDPIIAYASETLSVGTCLYEESIAGRSVAPSDLIQAAVSRRAAEKVPDWVKDVEKFSLARHDEEWRSTETSSVAGINAAHGSSSTTGSTEGDTVFSTPTRAPTTTSATLQEIDETYDGQQTDNQHDEGWDEEYETEMARTHFELARQAFESEDYQSTRDHLAATSEFLQDIAPSNRGWHDSNAMLFYQAICAFHLDDASTAEQALVAFLDNRSTSTEEEALQVCQAGYYLAFSYVRLGKLDLAATSAEGAARGRWKLVGSKHPLYYQAVALVARIYELQSEPQRSRARASLIPVELRQQYSTELIDLRPPTSTGHIAVNAKESLPRVPTAPFKRENRSPVTSMQPDEEVQRVPLAQQARSKGKAAAGEGNEVAAVQWEGIKQLDCRHRSFTRVAFSPNGKLVASGSRNGVVHIFDVATGDKLQTLRKGLQYLYSFSFSSNSQFLAIACALTTIQLWDVRTGVEIRQFSRYHPAMDVAFSPDGRFVVSGSLDNKVILWEADTSSYLREIAVHSGPVGHVVFSPDGQLVASASIYANKIFLSPVGGTTKSARPLDGRGCICAGMAFSPDGQFIASAAYDDGVLIHQASNRSKWKVFKYGEGAITALAYSPDGRVLALGCFSGRILLCSASTGVELGRSADHGRYAGHKERIWQVAFSPDGRLIASASEDRTVRLWNREVIPESPE